MSIKNYVENYSYKVSEQETIFRDLFGRQELEQTRLEYHMHHSMYITWLEYLVKETQRKLEAQDND